MVNAIVAFRDRLQCYDATDYSDLIGAELDKRIGTAFLLYAFVVIGIFLIVAPWTPVWKQSIIALLPTRIGHWMLTGWSRGVVSAVGVLDLLAAFQLLGELFRRPGSGSRRGSTDQSA